MARGYQDDQKKGNITYWSPFGEFLECSANENTKGAIKRKITKGINKGKEVYKRRIKRVEGQLIDIKLNKEGAYGWEWKVYLDVSLPDKQEIACITFGYMSDQAITLFKRLPSIDLSEDIVIKTFSDSTKNKDGKDVSVSRLAVFTVDADMTETVVPSHFTKENPLPAWKKVTKEDGSEEWDKSTQMSFIIKMIESLPLLGLDKFLEENTYYQEPNTDNDESENDSENKNYVTEEEDQPF